MSVKIDYSILNSIIIGGAGGSAKLGVNTSGTLDGYLKSSAGNLLLGPLNIPAGTLLTNPVDGALEYDGSQLYFTISGVRLIVAKLI